MFPTATPDSPATGAKRNGNQISHLPRRIRSATKAALPPRHGDQTNRTRPDDWRRNGNPGGDGDLVRMSAWAQVIIWHNMGRPRAEGGRGAQSPQGPPPHLRMPHMIRWACAVPLVCLPETCAPVSR